MWLPKKFDVKPRQLYAQTFHPTDLWLSAVKEVFFNNQETPAAFEIVMPASALNHCLLQRNEDWYQHKLPKAQEHHVFVTQFLPANMPVVSAIMTAEGQIRDDVGRFEFRRDQSLLKQPSLHRPFFLLVKGSNGKEEAFARTRSVAPTCSTILMVGIGQEVARVVSHVLC
jgi:hypothetical protein